MSTERATFSLELRDGISAPAASAVEELQRLRDGMGTGMQRLRELNEAMRRLRDGGDRTSETFRRLKAEIDNQKVANRIMQEAYVRLGGAFGQTAQAAQPAQGALGRLFASMKALGGPAGEAGERIERLTKGIGAAPLLVGGLALAAMLAVVATAAVAVARAAVRAAIDLGQYALASADARRTEMLRLEGLMTLRAYQRGAAGSATELVVAIDRVAASSALGRSDVSGFGEQLYRAGLRGAELQAALGGVTTTASVQGDRAAQRFLGMARALHRTGGSVRALSEDVRRRLGGIAQRQALALDVQARHLRESFAHLFDGLRLDGFLRGMREVTSLFSQNHAVGRALAAIMRSIFQPLLDGVSRAGPVVRTFFEGLTIMALRIGIGVLIVRNAVLRAFGADTVSQVDAMRIALYGGAAAALLLAVGIGLTLAPVLALGAALLPIWQNLQNFRASWAQLTEVLSKTHPQWVAAGSALVTGLVHGMRTAAQTLAPSVMLLADTLTDTFRGALEIRSPSRVFASLGREIPAGLAQGVREGSSLAADAVESVVEVPRARGGLSGGAPVVGELHVHVDGGGGARDIAEGIRDELVRLLAGIGSEIGAPA